MIVFKINSDGNARGNSNKVEYINCEKRLGKKMGNQQTVKPIETSSLNS